MSTNPKFITFTGLDKETNVDAIAALAADYPVEFGVLISPTRTGVDNRYPSVDVIEHFLERELPLALHVCGGFSKAIMDGERPDMGIDPMRFKRVQINHLTPDVEKIVAYADYYGVRAIAQWRDSIFPAEDRIDWLYDTSGGRGMQPMTWPAYPHRFVGYAGGISENNVSSILDTVGATGDYWIDMESSLRTFDKFDHAVVERVLRSVYGDKLSKSKDETP